MMNRYKASYNLANTKVHLGELWILIDSLTYGGIETHVVELSQGLKSFGQPVRVVLLSRYDQPSPIITKLNHLSLPYSYVEDLFVAMIRCINNPTKRKTKTSSLLGKLLSIVNHYQPRVLHGHGYKASIYSKLCKLKARNNIKQLTTFHAGERPVGKVKWYDRLDRYSAFVSDHCLSVSQAIQSKVPAPSLVLNNFITLPEPPNIQINHSAIPTRRQVAFVGRLSHEKGPDRFIELSRDFPDMLFSLYGDGKMRSMLEAQDTSNVVFEGFQYNMAEHWSHIDILLITSRFEGLPMTAIEAMAQGIPIISLDVGAITTLVQHNHNGWIARDMAELAKLLHAWSKLRSSDQARVQLNAYQTVKDDFSTDAVIPKLLALYS